MIISLRRRGINYTLQFYRAYTYCLRCLHAYDNIILYIDNKCSRLPVWRLGVLLFGVPLPEKF